MRITLRHKHELLALDLHPEGSGYRIAVDGVEHQVDAHFLDDANLQLTIDGQRYHVQLARSGETHWVGVSGDTFAFTRDSGGATERGVGSLAPPEIVAPMPGKVLELLVQPNQHVAAGDGLLILEAMKMENRVLAEAAATVAEVRVAVGDLVDGGQVLMVLRYDETPT